MYAGKRSFYLVDVLAKIYGLGNGVRRNFYHDANLRHNFRVVFHHVPGNRTAQKRRADGYGKSIAENFFQRENFVGVNAGVFGDVAFGRRRKIFRAHCRGAESEFKFDGRVQSGDKFLVSSPVRVLKPDKPGNAPRVQHSRRDVRGIYPAFGVGNTARFRGRLAGFNKPDKNFTRIENFRDGGRNFPRTTRLDSGVNVRHFDILNRGNRRAFGVNLHVRRCRGIVFRLAGSRQGCHRERNFFRRVRFKNDAEYLLYLVLHADFGSHQSFDGNYCGVPGVAAARAGDNRLRVVNRRNFNGDISRSRRNNHADSRGDGHGEFKFGGRGNGFRRRRTNAHPNARLLNRHAGLFQGGFIRHAEAGFIRGAFNFRRVWNLPKSAVKPQPLGVGI